MSAFDPATWLREFEAVGGWYVLTPDGHLAAGWRAYQNPERAQDEARRLVNALCEQAGRMEAVRQHVRHYSSGRHANGLLA